MGDFVLHDGLLSPPDLEGNGGSSSSGLAWSSSDASHRDVPPLASFRAVAGHSECELATRLDALTSQGRDLAHVMYGSRSLALAVPEQQPGSGTEAVEVEVFAPELARIKQLVAYVSAASDALVETVVRLATLEVGGDGMPAPVGLQVAALRTLDAVFVLDCMKDVRTNLKADFNCFKQAFVRAGLGPTELAEVQAFLSNQDPKKAYNYALMSLRETLGRIKGSDRVLCGLLNLVLDQLDGRMFVAPEERFGLMRLVPHLMVLVDGDTNDPKSYNVFQGLGFSERFESSAMGMKKGPAPPSVSAGALQKVVRRFPVVPVFHDVTLVLVSVLERAPHFNRAAMGDAWGAGAFAKAQPEPEYDVSEHWGAIRTDFSAYMALLAAVATHDDTHKDDAAAAAAAAAAARSPSARPGAVFSEGLPARDIQRLTSTSVPGAALVERARATVELALKGVALLSQWSFLLQLALAWMYTHPSGGPLPVYDGPKKPRRNSKSNSGGDYDRVVRNNLRPHDLCALGDIVSMTKRLAAALQRAEARWAPLVRVHMHHRIQQLARGYLLPLLHRVDKRKKAALAPLLTLRAMVADPKLLPGFADDSDFKGYSRKHGVVTADHQLRAVAAGTAQLHLLREQIRALCDEKSPYRQKQGLLSKPDVEKEDVACFESFYAESFYYPALLDLHGTVRRCADMSFLWYREYHLELMHCVQVPVESSLPWILAENCVAMQAHGRRRGTPGDAAGTGAGAGTVTGGALPAVENIFYLLDVYNDAADAALRLFRRPYLFEEIEAEAGLAAEHLVASLIDESYVYYKNLAASRLLDPAFVKRLDPSLFAVGVRGYSEVLRQRQVALVGRHVNVSAAAVRHFHASLFRDIDAAIRRFEAGDACGVVPLRNVLDVLRATHRLIVRDTDLHLDAFDAIFHEVDESLHMLTAIPRAPNPPAAPATPPTHDDDHDDDVEADVDPVFRGRVGMHLLHAVTQDLPARFAYNLDTGRFVRTESSVAAADDDADGVGLGPGLAGAGGRFRGAMAAAYGPLCCRAFEAQEALTAGFFGRPHVTAVLALGSYLSPRASTLEGTTATALWAALTDECLAMLVEQLRDAHDYLGALRARVPRGNRPPRSLPASAQAAYAYHLCRLQHIWGFADLKPEVLQLFRVMGNTLALLKDVCEAVEAAEQLRAAANGPLLETLQRVHAAPARGRPGGVPGGTGRDWSFRALLAHLHHEVDAARLLRDWVAQPTASTASAVSTASAAASPMRTPGATPGEARHGADRLTLQSAASRDLYHLWSTLSFLFCASHSAPSSTLAAPSDAARFGDGFAVTGCVLLHLLGEQDVFELCDVTRSVLRAHWTDVHTWPAEATAAPGSAASASVPSAAASSSSAGVKHKLTSMMMQAFTTQPDRPSHGAGQGAGADGYTGAHAEIERFVHSAGVQVHLQRQLFGWLTSLYPVAGQEAIFPCRPPME